MFKNFKLIHIPVILTLMAGALIVGITDFISFDYSTDRLTQMSFWYNIITTNLGIACIIICILILSNDKYKDTDVEFNALKTKINRFYNDAYHGPLFEKFCADKNRELKIAAYKKKQAKKFARFKPSSEDYRIEHFGNAEERSKNKYCKKLEAFRYKISPEYIRNNIDTMYVKYNTVSPALVFSGNTTTQESEEYITTNKAGKVLGDVLPKYLLSTTATILVTIAAPTFSDGITAALILNVGTKVFAICAQIFFAYNYANRYNVEVTLHDIQYRYSLITGYNLWAIKKNQEANTNGNT